MPEARLGEIRQLPGEQHAGTDVEQHVGDALGVHVLVQSAAQPT